MFKLIIQDDEGKTWVVNLVRDEITIGRKDGNSIRLTDRNVSRNHARIVRSNGSVLVEDLDSYNGVKVNGTRIQGSTAINEADRIQIGDYLIELKVDRGAGHSSGPVVPIDSNGLSGSAQVAVSATFPPAVRSQKPTLPMAPAAPTAEMTPVAPAESPVSAVMETGRLVVVSTNFAGREFALDKPALVVGRTDDNDIVINHRSISRHHAKIVNEHGRYNIVDMQSSNGVRVNGEEYGKVELRRGDMIDLGHVRLRYVEAGEDFVFERDVQPIDISTRAGAKRGALMALLTVVATGIGAALFFVVRGSSPSGTAADSRSMDNPPSRPTVPAPMSPSVAAPVRSAADASAADGAAAHPLGTNPSADPATKLVEAAKQLFAEEKWRDAEATANRALAADPANTDAKRLQEESHAELGNEELYRHFLEAKNSGKAPDAVRFWGQLPKSSVYRQKADAELPGLRDAYVQARAAEARGLAARGQCEKLELLARRSGEIFPDSKATFDKITAKCVPVEGDATKAAPTAALSDDEVQKLIEEAKLAAQNSNWSEARRKADEVLRVRPSDQDALSVGGMAACNLLDRERAAKYIGRLKGTRQNMMKQICATKGLAIE